ncbi:MAG: c-type cytochrome [Merismopedia sp. SIO2A8]|nr:c-type cytochrome [Symploca sp. SIO2B6]NET47679.1 c-type cytochrome [Merismopedia sp. SIO2A8]
MKRLIVALVCLVSLVLFAVPSEAMADGDAAKGASIFTANCAQCHLNGGNVINAAKTLKQADLDANGKNTPEAIITQVTNGNGAMPAFQGRLSSEDIENVAAYVLQQAAAGW